MSKEEILEEWLRQTDQTYINKGHKMVILNAMEEYAKYQVSKLPIHGVSDTEGKLFCSLEDEGFCPYEKEGGECMMKDPCINHTTK